MNNSTDDLPTSAMIKDDGNGRKVFYPWGVLGKGYYVPNAAKAEKINNIVFVYFGITSILISIGIWIGLDNTKWLSGFLLLPMLIFWYRVKIKKLVQDLEVIPVGSSNYSPPTIDKRYRKFLVTMLVLGVIGGLGNIYNKGFSADDFLLVVASSGCLLAAGYVYWFRK